MKRRAQTNAIDVIMSKEADEKRHVSSMSNQEFVKLVYNAVLRRDPDATGLNDYTFLLNNGVPRTAVIKEIVESVEFSEKWNKTVKTLTFDANVCTAVYNNLLSQGFQVIKPTSTTIKIFDEELKNVKNLDVSGKSLKNLKGISQFTNLTKLSAQNNALTDITELSKLSNLTYLNLNNCSLSAIDLTPIKSETKLQELHLDSNGLRNISKIGGMQSLQKLYVNSNNIATISESVLTNNLKELYADKNRIADTGYFDSTKLTKISLKNNKIEISNAGKSMFTAEIIDNALTKTSKLYATGGLKYDKCKKEGNKIVLNDNVAVATVTIVGGPADGTVITYKNTSVK